ncbi:MAG: sugar transferase [Phycisphaerales bacterium]
MSTATSVAPPPSHTRGERGKRLLDVVGAALLVVLAALPMAAVALLVRIVDGRPVLFRQERVGRHGRRFVLLKFRTMVPNAESLRPALAGRNEADGPLFKIRDDPRVTRLGSRLRRTSLDELPQLWNVLRGDMSLVGPRPALPAEVTAWPADLHRRLDVRPGLTGPWQVAGRAAASFEDYRRHDLAYVDGRTLLGDVGLLLRTIPAVLRGRGAL